MNIRDLEQRRDLAQIELDRAMVTLQRLRELNDVIAPEALEAALHPTLHVVERCAREYGAAVTAYEDALAADSKP